MASCSCLNTWARLAAATGSLSNSENISETDFPKSSSIMRSSSFVRVRVRA